MNEFTNNDVSLGNVLGAPGGCSPHGVWQGLEWSRGGRHLQLRAQVSLVGGGWGMPPGVDLWGRFGRILDSSIRFPKTPNIGLPTSF